MDPLGIRLKSVSATFRHPERGDVIAVRGIDLDVKAGELLTLLGPSGCGKTTTLRIIAGFQQPSAGSIEIGGMDVTSTPANKRNIGLVFQSYALFPHLSVFENVAYGLRVRRKSKSDTVAAVTNVLSLVGLAGFDQRFPAELSGGQQQRVALARAIVIEPGVLLFDEPLSNLDAKLRVEMRNEIRRLQARLGITTIYVTHDQEEAMAISDRIAIMRGGQIAQLASAEELYERPNSRFVAEFLGRANIIHGRVTSTGRSSVTLDINGNETVFDSSDDFEEGARLIAIVRPESIIVRPQDTEGLQGEITSRVYLGDKVEYAIKIGDQSLQAVITSPNRITSDLVGSRVGIYLPHQGVRLLRSDIN